MMVAQINLHLARTHKNIFQMEHGEKAERLYKSSVDLFTKELGSCSIKTLNVYHEYIKFLIKEDRCGVCRSLLLVLRL